ncbi:MAG: TetR family transcriptional regulator [Proteobacteria bacterium]|nr:TetR family transcriptional regulator [Pseudomonadota bacterium]
MATRRTSRRSSTLSSPGRSPGVRERAAQATQESILRAATKIFAEHGYDGATVEKISKAARSYDRMIYYYFGNKEGLFVAVLEEAYRRFNEAEAALELDPKQSPEAMKEVVRFMVRYYRDNPEFVTLLNSENLQRGKHVAKSLRAGEYSLPAIGIVERILRAGAARGLFRPDVSARDLYLMIAGLGYFYQSNRYTLSAFLGENLEAPAAQAHWESFVIDSVLRAVSPASSTVELVA